MRFDERPVPPEAQIREGALLLWCVVSEPYEHSSCSYYEPPDTYPDYREVYARTARRARVLAVRAWRRANRMYYGGGRPAKLDGRNLWRLQMLTSERMHYYHDEHPFKGVTAYRLPTAEWVDEQIELEDMRELAQVWRE